MSILTKKEIFEKIKNQQMVFSPELDEYQIQPGSIDLRLGWNFYIPHQWKISERGRVAVNADYLDYQNTEEYFKLIKLSPTQYFEILPHEFIIVATLEKITLNCGGICGNLYPRSSTLRRGLQIESGIVDCRYNGQLTIPITNNSNHIIKLYPGERICQLQLIALSSELNEEEAQKHGKSQAKYIGSTPYGLEAKADSNDELALIKQGNIDELKKQFAIKFNEQL